jgi:5-methylthioadenosine/S-adenosylhomocysteine deaminase
VAPEPTGQPLDVELAVTHGTVVTASPTDGAGDVIVLVDDGRFAYVGPIAGAPSHRARQTIDARGKFVYPGLVNTHTHIYQCLLRGRPSPRQLPAWLDAVVFPALHRLTPEIYEVATMVAGVEALHSGTTTLLDYTVDHADTAIYAAAIAGARRAGVRLHLARGVSGRGRSGSVPTPTSAALDHTRTLAAGADEPVSLALPPIAALSDDSLKAVAEFVVDTGTPVTAHVAEVADDDQWCRREHGESSVRRLHRYDLIRPGFLGVHCVHLDGDDIAMLAAGDASVSYNPVSNRYLQAGDAPLAEITGQRLRVALGTDGAASNGKLDMIEAMKWAALGDGAPADTVTAARWALAIATRDAAKALGVADRGVVATGRSADFFIYDPDRTFGAVPHGAPAPTLVYSGSPQGVDCVVVKGRVVLKDGVSTLLDEADLRAAAASAASRLAASC